MEKLPRRLFVGGIASMVLMFVFWLAEIWLEVDGGSDRFGVTGVFCGILGIFLIFFAFSLSDGAQ